MTSLLLSVQEGINEQSGSAVRQLPLSEPFSVYLDCVRILAALLVVLAHCKGQGMLPGSLPLDDFGHEAVIIFFVLSGIVIRSTLSETATAFAVARVTRLYSVVLPALLVSYLSTYVLFAVVGVGESKDFFSDSGGLRGLLMSFFFLNESWFSWNDVPSNGPYWSLCYEAWYYAFFGCWMYLKGRSRILACAAVALAAGPRILILMPLWFAGVQFAERLRQPRPRNTPWGLAMILLGLCGVVASDYFDVGHQVRTVTHGFLPMLWVLRHSELFVTDYLVAACVLMNFAGFLLVEERLAGLMRMLKRPIRWLAGSSFSIYLFHYPLLLLIPALTEVPRTWMAAATVYALVVCTCIALSYLSEKQKGRFSRLLQSAFQWNRRVIERQVSA